MPFWNAEDLKKSGTCWQSEIIRSTAEWLTSRSSGTLIAISRGSGSSWTSWPRQPAIRRAILRGTTPTPKFTFFQVRCRTENPSVLSRNCRLFLARPWNHCTGQAPKAAPGIEFLHKLEFSSADASVDYDPSPQVSANSKPEPHGWIASRISASRRAGNHPRAPSSGAWRSGAAEPRRRPGRAGQDGAGPPI